MRELQRYFCQSWKFSLPPTERGESRGEKRRVEERRGLSCEALELYGLGACSTCDVEVNACVYVCVCLCVCVLV